MTIIPNFQTLQEETLEFSLFDRIARDLVFSKLRKLKKGYLKIIIGAQQYEFGELNSSTNLCGNIKIHNAKTFQEILSGGEIAAGRTYVQGWWSSEDLLSTLRVFTANRDVAINMKGLGAKSKKIFRKYIRRSNKNTFDGSKKNIHAHYDIGNDFYELFLDERKMYSSAYFSKDANNLESASENKLKVVCEKLKLKPNDQVIEIGSGWGGFAEYAIENYGCHVTTTTISKQQFNYLEQKFKDNKFRDKITILYQDYRHLKGSYDKLVSIEMIESVGHEYMDAYFTTCSDLLNPEGVMLIQAITMSDHIYNDYIYSNDFIRQYIFPGGFLPSVAAMLDSTSRNTDLSLFHSESFAASYASTLNIWYQRFIANKDKVIELGYPQSLIRLWEYYLKYCEAGFSERVIDVHHLVFKKPDNRMTQYVMQ